MEKETKLNMRTVFFGIGSIIIVFAMFLTDPDDSFISNLPFGASTVTFLIYLSTAIIGVGLLYLCERVLFSYVNYQEVYLKALKTENGPGLIMVAISLQSIAAALVIMAMLK